MLISIFVGLVCAYYCFCYLWARRSLYNEASKYPGPPGYPIIGNANLLISFKDIVDNAIKLVHTYGLTFKLWVFNVLVIMTAEPKYNQIVLNSPHCLEKEHRYDAAKEAFGNGLLTAPAEIWKIHRRVINPTFNQKILDTFVPIFIEQSDILVEQLGKEAINGEIFDVHEYLSKCSLDLISETAMGCKVNAQTTCSKFLHCTRRAAQIIIERAFRVWLHPDFMFQMSGRGREFRKCVEFSRAFIDDLIEKRKVEFEQTRDTYDEDNLRRPFLEHLMMLGNELSFVDLRNEVAVFITAGSDTVSTTTGYVLVCLAMHQDIQQKVMHELDSIYEQTDRPIDIDDLSKMIYLERVIKETMRLYPPAPFVARSVTEDVNLGDYKLPKGSAAVVSIIGTHRNSEYWPDPLRYDPDRFLPENSTKRHPYSYIPFSAGPRNCIGIRYAMMAMKVLLTTVLRSYHINTNLTPEKIKLSVEIISKIIGGANISISKRVNAHQTSPH